MGGAVWWVELCGGWSCVVGGAEQWVVLCGGWCCVMGGAVWWVELCGGWSFVVGGAERWVELSCIYRQMHTFIYYTQAVFNHIGMFTRVFKQIDISRMYRLNYNPSRGFLP